MLARTSTIPSQAIGAVAYGERPHVPAAFDSRIVETDARGRMISDAERRYIWNDADQLVGVSRDGGGAVESAYGEDGVRRVRVEHGSDGVSSTTHFIDAWTEARDGQLARYIVHGGQRIVKLGSDSGAVGRATPATAGPGAATWRGPLSAARAASATGPGLLCALAFALTVVTRSILLLRRRWSFRALSSLLPAVAAGAGLALVAASAVPAMAAIGVALLAALCVTRHRAVARATRVLVACIGVLAAVGACGGSGGEGSGNDVPTRQVPRAPINELTEADTLIVTDLLGSVLGETSGAGVRKSEFATYPFGAARYDTSHATWKFAGTPRDSSVALDHMGARFYAPELGVWTSGDPVAITDPERLVTPDFAAANPYAYAKQSPLIAADRDGNFWHVALGAAVGALVGGGIEAGRQYLAHGKVEDWGRVYSASAGGAVSGTIVALNPAAGFASVIGIGAESGAAAGVTERLVASGGKSAGTLTDMVIDAGVGAVTAGVGKGAGALVKSAAHRAAAGARGLATTQSRQAIPRLSKGVASSFEGQRYEGRVLTEELHVFRAEGKHYGRWYGTVEPESAAHAERLYNIVDYDNDATTVSRYRIPKGRLIYDGPVAGGNGTQIFVPDSHAAGVELVETKPLVQFGF